jgi:phosphate transport system substrate-binding protein
MRRNKEIAMKRSLLLAALGLPFLFAIGCSRGGDGTGRTKDVRLSGTGASFIYPMMSKWASEYEKAKGVKINYQSTGSGAGIQQMTAQTVDFGCSDGPMNDEQLKKAKQVKGDVVHIPLAMGGVVPAYNLSDSKETLKFSGPVLAKIYLNQIKKWNDAEIQKLNPGAALPDLDILVVHRSDGSGTTYIFVDYLSKISSEWKDKVGVGTSVKWPTGTGAKGNEGVAGLVKRTPGSIGYVELIYALSNDIKYGSVKNKAGEYVSASLASVTAAAKASLDNIREDLRYSITDAPGKESYPIAGTSWAICYTDNPGGKGKEVREFFHWCTHDGQQFCEALHYSKLPKGLVERVEKRLALVTGK